MFLAMYIIPMFQLRYNIDYLLFNFVTSFIISLDNVENVLYLVPNNLITAK